MANLTHDVNDEIVGIGGERRVGERFGIIEKGKCDFGIVPETEEDLVEKVRGKGDAVELQRRLHGVEGIVMLEEDL